LDKRQRFEKEDKTSHIVNLADKILDGGTLELLEKGLNFVVAPKRIPLEDIICNVENVIKDLPENNVEDIRQDCTLVLKNAKPPKKNITKDEVASLKILRDRKDIIILKVDKGNTIVVMKKEDYNQKMIEHLASGGYRKVQRDPMNKFIRSVSLAIKNSSLDETLKKKLTPKKNSIMPCIYGLQKFIKLAFP
jgi:hypothetical protein